MPLFETLAASRRSPSYRFWLAYYRLRGRLSSRVHRQTYRLQRRFPRLVNEGRATALVINDTFDGFPFPKDYPDREAAVTHLQLIWDILDDYGDGRRENVRRMYEGIAELRATYQAAYTEARAARLATEPPDDLADITFHPQSHGTRVVRARVVRRLRPDELADAASKDPSV